jgi:hypothetical protein
VRVSVAAPSTLRDQHAFTRLRKVMQRLVGSIVVNDGPDGNLYFKVGSVFSVTRFALTVLSAFCAEGVVETEFQQGVFVGVRYKVDAAAVPAVSAARTSKRNELLAAEGNAAVSAVSCFKCDFRLVDERSYSTGWIEMNLPVAPLSSNCTIPAIFANKVSSLPMPTFKPGLNFVPR